MSNESTENTENTENTETYSRSRFYALSDMGYGRGDTPAEAIEQYVEAQLRNFPAKNTTFKSPAKWAKALRTGEAKSTVYLAPEGTTGFVQGYGGLQWTSEVDGKTVYAEAKAEEVLDFSPARLAFLASFDKADA